MQIIEQLKVMIPYLSQIMQQAKFGITITDPNQEDNPLIYVNIIS